MKLWRDLGRGPSFLYEFAKSKFPLQNHTTLTPSYSKVYSKIRRQPMPYSIMLDAGHGGRDPGAVYNGRQEKDDVFALSFEIGV